MKLVYHKGQNFGDAVNPLIFGAVLGDLLDEGKDELLLGIGSILGLMSPPNECKKFIVFSSGFAGGDASTYGDPPEITDKYDVICVRGYMTAKAIGVSEDKVISDGALLVSKVLEIPDEEVIYDFSYMPHIGSLDLYDKWKETVEELGIHFIDPRKSPFEVLKQMKQSKVLFTEAMHGAIIADSLQIPWVPVKTNKSINDFKWRDYLGTVNLNYSPHVLPTLYSREFLNTLFSNKLKKFKLSFLARLFSSLYLLKQRFTINKTKKLLLGLKNVETSLCTSEILAEKQDQLLKAIDEIIHTYKKN